MKKAKTSAAVIVAMLALGTTLPMQGQSDPSTNKPRSAIFKQAEEASQKGDFPKAIQLLATVSSDRSDPALAAKASYNAGVLKRKAGQPEEAIAEFKKLIASKPNDREAGGDLMTAYRNYSHQSAVQIADILEEQGNLKEALEYAKLATTKYKYQSWCGTCSMEEASEESSRIKRLKALIYKAELNSTARAKANP